VDIMPTTPGILGFSNRWYPAAVAEAQRYQLPGGPNIRLISPACFLATKLDAFANRGKGDYLASHDLDDIVSVIDGRSTIEQDIASASSEVREFLASAFVRYLASESFVESLPGHLEGNQSSQARLPRLMARIGRIARKNPQG
jgi:hypothetical protein